MGWILFILSLIIAGLTLFKPAFFWNTGRMLSLRNRVGDRRAVLIYYIICTIFGGIGLMDVLKIIDLS